MISACYIKSPREKCALFLREIRKILLGGQQVSDGSLSTPVNC